MKTSQLSQLAVWSAYLNVAAMFAAGIIPIVSITGLWGKMENLATMIFALSMVPLAFVAYWLQRVVRPRLSAFALLIGVSAMLAAASVKALVFIDAISSVGIADFLDDFTFALVGIWLILVGLVSRKSGTREPVPALLPIVAGIGYVAVTGGFLLSEPPPVWALVGGAVVLVTYPVWVISMARALSEEQLIDRPASG